MDLGKNNNNNNKQTGLDLICIDADLNEFSLFKLTFK